MFRRCSGQYVPTLYFQQHPCCITFLCDYEVKMAYERCPSDYCKCTLLFVARNLHRTTLRRASHCDQKTFNSKQNLNMKIQQKL